jgi:hypothetical protein
MRTKAGIKRTLAFTALLALTGAAILAGYFAGRARAAGIPTMQPLTYSGVLTDASGAPLTGSKNIQIMFFNAAADGTPACSTLPAAQMLVGGTFQVTLPDACVTAVRASANVWVEVFVDGGSLGRTKLGAVPYAIEAGEASCGLGVTGMIDTGAGFCIDSADRALETEYASSVGTCAMEGKVVCSFVQLCTAQLRGVGGLSATVDYRVSDLMFYGTGPGGHYLGGGAGDNSLALPAACKFSAPGPSAGKLTFRCCRGKG